MEANAGLIAGSHNRNELVVIRDPASDGPKPLNHANGLICNICGDDVGLTVDGELFVACFECGFPVCRPCFEYERKEGNQSCPQCKSRYNRQKGSVRVPGDDEEDDTDDLENGNGYLLQEFMAKQTNLRTDEYGGSVENRARFVLEVVDASVDAIGAGKVGIKLQQGVTFSDLIEPEDDVIAQYEYLGPQLEQRKLAYVCLSNLNSEPYSR